MKKWFIENKTRRRAKAKEAYHTRPENKLKRLASIKKYNIKLRDTVFNHYGWKCVCCGETHKEFLTIDHINGGGNKHKQEVGRGGRFFLWIIKNNFPLEFRVLCYNCNCSRGHKGYCPHEMEKEFTPEYSI